MPVTIQHSNVVVQYLIGVLVMMVNMQAVKLI